jgi:hypothetical protein
MTAPESGWPKLSLLLHTARGSFLLAVDRDRQLEL